MSQGNHSAKFTAERPRGFASDNYAGVHPRILDALLAANAGHQVSYGDDEFTADFDRVIEELFGPTAKGFAVFNGTAANVIALQSCVGRWQSVICAESAHIHNDEGGAPEVVAGIKLWIIPTADGKLTPELIKPQLARLGNLHQSQPAAISISNTTELGTVYRADEIKAIADLAHENGLLLHLDGARLSNAAASLGLPFGAFTTDVGVDLVSLGGTKIGAMAAEAVVVLNPALAEKLPYLRKTSMQLASKMRYISVQLIELFSDRASLAISAGQHANAMAARLDAGLRALGIQVPNATQANAVFPIFDAGLTERLQREFRFYVWDATSGMVRLMCSWDTTEADVDELLLAVARESTK